MIVLIVFCLISVKFYYLYLYNLNSGYSQEFVYNNGDASHYLVIGKNMADFNVYSDTNSKTVSETATWRPPFWPLVLSIFFKFTTSPLVLILLKSILEMGILFFALFKFKNKSNLKLIYLIPFLLLLVEPQYLKYSITFLSESLTAILMLLLVIYFILRNKTKSQHIAIPILSSMVILCHPASIFFVLSLFVIYLLINLRANFLGAMVQGILFSILLLAWPYRNYVTFDKGFYLTASQGATFSKGWNEKVAAQFTNVDGDLADEGLNLKYVDNNVLKNADNSMLTQSILYSIGTINFIKSIGFKDKIKIALKKLKSNFNPFPEKPKPGFIESIAIFFRMLYLFTFLQLIIRFFKKEKMDYNLTKDRVYLVVLAVFIGQIGMSIYIYTGLRFNSIYSLTMLFCFIYLNNDFLIKMYKKYVPIKFQTFIHN